MASNYNPLIDDPGFETDLIMAASNGQVDHIKFLLQQSDVCLDAKNSSGWTALMYASHMGHHHVVDQLVKAGCDVGITEDVNGTNALMMAAGNGHTYCAERIVQSGRADLMAIDRFGRTAFDHAALAGHGRNKAMCRALRVQPLPSLSETTTVAKIKPPSNPVQIETITSANPRKQYWCDSDQTPISSSESNASVLGTYDVATTKSKSVKFQDSPYMLNSKSPWWSDACADQKSSWPECVASDIQEVSFPNQKIRRRLFTLDDESQPQGTKRRLVGSPEAIEAPTKAVSDLIAENEALEKQIKALRNDNAGLVNENRMLRHAMKVFRDGLRSVLKSMGVLAGEPIEVVNMYSV